VSFFDELKRRNVFRVGIAYAVSAWVLLQIVDLVLENITAPEWVMQVFMLALAIGFPVAVIFAWAFEMTPDGVKLEKHVDRSQSITRKTGQKMNRNITIALGLAVVLLLADRFLPDTETEPQVLVDSVATSVDTSLTDTASEKSIAVLPFVDMSPESDQAYFADGISEEILNVLVKTHSLKVAGRTSSFQFRGRNEDLRNIGELLGVENILEGSIRKFNNRVRITAQLVNAKDGFHLWSETYDRELTDIFAIQDEIARAITGALAIELNLAESGQSLVTASTRNMEAYDKYLEAKGLIARRLDFPRTLQLLNEATHMDPGFAEGWAAKAQAHSLSYYYITGNRIQAMNEAEASANKALEINPDLSMAHSVLGDVFRDRYQWIKAEKNYQRALALNPDDIEANEQFAQMLWRASYLEEALVFSSKAVELDPLSWLNLTVDSSIQYASGNHVGGWEKLQRVLKLGGSNRDFALRHAVRMAVNDDDFDMAVTYMKALSMATWKRHNDDQWKAHFDAMISILHSKEETLAFLTASKNDAVSSTMASPWAIDVFWAAYYGDFRLAEEILDIGISNEERLNDTHDTSWFNYPILSPLFNTEPYKQMIRRTKLDQYWRIKGFPLYCKPMGEDDFACQ
jgi:TolB-like protein/Tfp pilus assembly protein PilF